MAAGERETHLLKEEVEIWRRYRALGGLAGYRVDFDVHVGRGPRLDPSTPENVRRMADAIARPRIDAVATGEREIVIVEIKPRAHASNVGQVKNYGRLYQETFTPPLPIRLMVLARDVNSNTREFFEAEGVDLVLV